MGTILGLVVLALDIWAVIDAFKSDKSTVQKVLWTAAILVLPVIGLIVYFVLGRKASTTKV